MRRLVPILAAVCCAASFSTFAQPPTGTAAGNRAQSLGAVRPSNLVLMQLGVSSFTGGSQATLVGDTIQRDLALADIAVQPTNQAAATAAAARDREAGQLVFDGWVAAGVNYVVRGTVSGDSLQVELYDIASKQRTLGKSYSGYSDPQARRFAHRAADDLMKAIGNMPGIFSSQVCYVSDRRGGTKEVMVMDADGGGARQVTNENALVATPCWGKNGTEIYFTSYRDNNPDLYGITLSGRRFEISRRPGLNISPSWSGWGARLAVSPADGGHPAR